MWGNDMTSHLHRQKWSTRVNYTREMKWHQLNETNEHVKLMELACKQWTRRTDFQLMKYIMVFALCKMKSMYSVNGIYKQNEWTRGWMTSIVFEYWKNLMIAAVSTGPESRLEFVLVMFKALTKPCRSCRWDHASSLAQTYQTLPSAMSLALQARYQSSGRRGRSL